MSKEATTKERRKAPLETPTDLGSNARRDIAGALNALLADTFALYLKTKNFHWHVSGPHFRSLHLLFDEHGDQIFAMTDEIAERVRKVGGLTIHSIGEISRLQRIPDNDADYVDPLDMVAELRSDNQALISAMREAHELCDEENDVATASLIGELDRPGRAARVVPLRDEPPRRPRALIAGAVEGSERFAAKTLPPIERHLNN